ncbi:hypothetical protein FHY55_00305 [Oceanicola sp. D3]|uniref:hypothetical protein n=1 Tax=Oceanicola sp. D3 TaxID=2587163 RepID=UPI00111F5EBC|nr:hypothetical protein [Oceanicola sp. D3]QDC07780.1 hypothetical protein FHY55_00305 [Oceanicola sp. D3]
MISFSDWPKRQVLHDLRCVAQASRPAAEARGDAALLAVPLEADLQLACDDDYLSRITALTAVARSEDAELAGYAMALLIGDAVHGQIGFTPDALPVARQPRARRAALARGLHVVDEVHELGTELPELETSLPPERVIAPLVQIAQELRGMVDAVAMADYGMDAERHAEALRAVLDAEGCRFPKGERWYPAEVVELTGHDPDNGATWFPCIALLVLDDIHHHGDFDQMTFRWMRHAKRLVAAPEHVRKPILAGIRHLLESGPPGEWDPYWDWMPQKIAEQAVMVPWEDVA